MRRLRLVAALAAVSAAFLLGRFLPHGQPPATPVHAAEAADSPAAKGWTKGKGYGWVYGKDDEVGALNAMSSESVKAALSLAKTGRVYDLGVPYDRNSFRWPGHNPGEII